MISSKYGHMKELFLVVPVLPEARPVSTRAHLRRIAISVSKQLKYLLIRCKIDYI